MTQMESQLKTITIQINGSKQDVPTGATLEDLVSLFHLQKKAIAVEHNHQVTDRSLYGKTQLKADDQVEIVHFVGGG